MNNAFRRLTATSAGWGPLVLRVPVGIIFAAHGAQKLFGWFEGRGLRATAEGFSSMGLNPGFLMAILAGSAEFFGGIALVIGFLVRPAGAALSIAMLVAVFAVHFEYGLFLSNNGYEYALALLAASASLMLSGAGRLSLDEMLAAH